MYYFLFVTINSPSGNGNVTYPTYEYFLVLVCNIYYIYWVRKNSMPRLREVMGGPTQRFIVKELYVGMSPCSATDR
jgi:hypothetical protein